MSNGGTIEEEARQRLRATEEALFKQNEVLLGLARSEAIDGGHLDAAFREITEASANALGLERVGVWFYADETKDAMSSPDLFLRSTKTHTTAPLLSHTSFPTYFAHLARERAIPADDAHTHPATCELSEAYLTPLGIGSLLDAPIRWHGRMVGLVCHEHVGPARTWTQDEINFAGSMADLVARALEADARRKAQEELLAANRTLEEKIAARTRELADRNQELLRLYRLKDEMFQNVSHELRTPLTLILSPIERMLQRETTSPDDRRRLDSVRNNALRLLGLVNDVLDLAKLESTQTLPTRAVAIDFGKTTRRLVADVVEAAAARGQSLAVEAPEGVHATLDERHLERIVLNLLSNAMKFTPAGGEIRVIVSADAAGFQLAVKDSGIGIPEESLGTIFERFRQLDQGRARKYEGTGIGLTLVSELTRLLGGTIAVASRVGEGTTFTLSFPASLRAAAPAVETPTPEAELFREAAHAALRRDASGPRVRGERGPLVVVAEDEPGIRNELAEILSAKCRVLVCKDGEDALEAIIEKHPHVVISDVMMPNMDGLELVRALRQRPELRDTAVVLLSAKTEVEDRVRGRELGVDTYLTKPFHPQEVLATVEGLLRSRMRLIGRYLVHERLGAGGQSQVFRAENVETASVVALKIIAQAGIDDTSSRERLQRERRTLAELSHPNIVRVIDEGPHEAGYYIVMEYLHGETLSEYVRRNGPLSSDEVVELGAALASALEAVHGHGLVHRDVKASNTILVHSNAPLRDRVRLIDFGTVYSGRTLTEDASLVGTLAYLAPEIFQGGVASVASDIYALGVTLYLLATGHLPFGGASRVETVEAILQSRLPAPTIGAPLLEALIVRAVAKDPAARFSTARELKDALAAIPLQVQQPSGVRPTSLAREDETLIVRG